MEGGDVGETFLTSLVSEDRPSSTDLVVRPETVAPGFVRVAVTVGLDLKVWSRRPDCWYTVGNFYFILTYFGPPNFWFYIPWVYPQSYHLSLLLVSTPLPLGTLGPDSAPYLVAACGPGSRRARIRPPSGYPTTASTRPGQSTG